MSSIPGVLSHVMAPLSQAERVKAMPARSAPAASGDPIEKGKAFHRLRVDNGGVASPPAAAAGRARAAGMAGLNKIV